MQKSSGMVLPCCLGDLMVMLLFLFFFSQSILKMSRYLEFDDLMLMSGWHSRDVVLSI